MRILLDECVNHRLKRELVGLAVSSVRDEKWQGIRNGELLKRLEGRFDVFVTVDRNIEFQNVFAEKPFAIVVLVTRNGTLQELRALVPELRNKLPNLRPGTVTTIRMKADA